MKYYVVWNGRKPGIYTTWEECKAQVHKYKQARYKSFKTRSAAEEAFNKRPEDYFYVAKKAPSKVTDWKHPTRNREPLPKVKFPKFPR